MQVDRISVALTRIETAALRIKEAAEGRRVSERAGSDKRYDLLRSEAASALAELDQLIARLEP